MKTLLKNAELLHADATFSPPADLLLEDGLIKDIGQGLEAGDAEVVDCTGTIISPGLCVLHAHSPMHILRGLAEDVHIDDWFNKEIFPYESKLCEDDIYWGTRLCCAEMLDNGVTAFADHYFSGPTILRAARDAGIRIDLALTAFGLDLEKDIDDTLALIEAHRTDDMARVRFGPHSPYMVSPQALERLVGEAKGAGVGIHLHVAETELQERQSRERYGKSHCQIISEAGGFGLPCIVAHGLWIADEDVALLGEDTYVAVSPKTYMKLGAGAGTLWRHAGQFKLCIGTDGAASSNSVRPLEQAMLFALCGKWNDAAEDFTLGEMWRALMRGHGALPFGGGALAKGAPADLVVWDLNTPGTGPLYNKLAALVYSAGAANVRHTLVGGRFAKRDGRLCQDVPAMMEQARACARGIYQRGKGRANVQF